MAIYGNNRIQNGAAENGNTNSWIINNVTVHSGGTDPTGHFFQIAPGGSMKQTVLPDLTDHIPEDILISVKFRFTKDIKEQTIKNRVKVDIQYTDATMEQFSLPMGIALGLVELETTTPGWYIAQGVCLMNPKKTIQQFVVTIDITNTQYAVQIDEIELKQNTGAVGPKGKDGVDGLPGIGFRTRGVWAEGNTYLAGGSDPFIDIVTSGGSTFYAKQKHTSSDTNRPPQTPTPTENAYWGVSAYQGAQGPIGKGYRNRGSWLSGETYVNNDQYIDTVNFAGCLFASRTDNNQGHQPPSTPTDNANWKLLVSRGNDGQNGADANLLDWVQNWDGTKVNIKGQSIITPKLFAGINGGTADSPRLTGIALGRDVLGGSNATIGIAGYNDNHVNFLLKPDGSAVFGRTAEHQFIVHSDGTVTVPRITANRIVGDILKLGGNNAETSLELSDSQGNKKVVANKDSNNFYNMRALDASGKPRAIFGQYGSDNYGVAILNQFGDIVTDSNRPPSEYTTGYGKGGCELSINSINHNRVHTEEVSASNTISEFNYTNFRVSNLSYYQNLSNAHLINFILHTSDGRRVIMESVPRRYLSIENGRLHVLTGEISPTRNWTIVVTARPVYSVSCQEGFAITPTGRYIKVNAQSTNFNGSADFSSADARYNQWTWLLIYVDKDGILHTSQTSSGIGINARAVSSDGKELFVADNDLPNKSEVDSIIGEGFLIGLIVTGPSLWDINQNDIFTYVWNQKAYYIYYAPLYVTTQNEMRGSNALGLEYSKYLTVTPYRPLIRDTNMHIPLAHRVNRVFIDLHVGSIYYRISVGRATGNQQQGDVLFYHDTSGNHGSASGYTSLDLSMGNNIMLRYVTLTESSVGTDIMMTFRNETTSNRQISITAYVTGL